MKRIALIIVVLFSMVATAIAAEFPVYFGPNNQRNPDISLSPTLNCPIVIWEAVAGDTSDIYGKYLDISGGCEGTDPFTICDDITIGSYEQSYPAVDGDIVVWQDRSSGDWDIWGKDLSSGEPPFPVFQGAGDQKAPAISGNYVVWKGSDGIYYKDITDPGGIPIKCADLVGAPYAEPDIDGDIIVWARDNEIYGYDIVAGGEPYVICQEGSADKRNPSISGNIVVWEDHRSGGPNYEIYYAEADMPNQVGTKTSPDGLFWNRLPALYGEVVVWYAQKSDGDPYSLFVKNIYAAIDDYFLVSDTNTTHASNLFRPAISNVDGLGKIITVWHDDKMGDGYLNDIYGRRVDLDVDFEANYPIGPPTLAAIFSDTTFSTMYAIDTWEWDLDGDGDVDYTGQAPPEQHYEVGDDRSYTVSLTVTGGFGTAVETKEDYINLLPLYYVELFNEVLKAELTYWNDELGKWEGKNWYDIIPSAPHLLYQLSNDPAAIPPGLQAEDLEDIAKRTIDYHLGLFNDVLDGDIANWNPAYIQQRKEEESFNEEAYIEFLAGIPCWVDGLEYYTENPPENFDDLLFGIMLVVKWAVENPDTVMPYLFGDIFTEYGSVPYIMGSLLALTYQYAEVSDKLARKIFAKIVGLKIYQYLEQDFWGGNFSGPCKWVPYYHYDGGPTYCEFYLDPATEQHPTTWDRRIAFINSTIMVGLAKMYEITKNQDIKDRFDAVWNTINAHHWNPEVFNPYGDPQNYPLYLGYCTLDDPSIPTEPQAALSTHAGFSWALTRQYIETDDLNYLYFEQGQNYPGGGAGDIYDTTLGGFRYEGSEYYQFIGLSWIDIQDDFPYQDIGGQFICRHHNNYSEGEYELATRKCIGCNMILLNGLYDFLKEMGQWQ